MTGKTHQIIGIITGVGSYLAFVPPAYHPATFAGVLVVSSLGSLLPDIDSPAAKIYGYLPFGKEVGQAVNPFLQHRNLTHSLLGLVLVSWGLHTLFGHIPLYWNLDPHVVLHAFIIAYASHIIADALTVQGVPLLFPDQHMFGFPPHPFQGLRVETGHWFENLIIFPAVNIIMIAMFWHYWSTVHALLFLS